MANIANQMQPRLPSMHSTAPAEAVSPQPAAPVRRPPSRLSPVRAEDVPPAAKSEPPTLDVESALIDGTPASAPAPARRRRRNTSPLQTAQAEQQEAPADEAPASTRRRNTLPPQMAQAERQEAPTPTPGSRHGVPSAGDERKEEAQACQAVALRKPNSNFSCGGFDDGMDDADPTDIVLPRLNIAQKVGELSQSFEAGTLVLGATVALENPSNVLVLAKKSKVYVERVPGGNPGRTLYSKAEVAEAGGTLDYNEAKDREIPLFQTMITWMVLVEAPADASAEELDMFPFEYPPDGRRFALALWSTKGTAYTHAAKHLITARKHGMFKGRLVPHVRNGGFLAQFFKLGTKIEKYDRNFAAIPVLILGEQTTPEFAAWVKAELGGDEASAAVAAAAARTPVDIDEDVD